MGWRIPVTVTEECIACGNCEQVCPEVFRLNESSPYEKNAFEKKINLGIFIGQRGPKNLVGIEAGMDEA
jgi:ferredoxin